MAELFSFAYNKLQDGSCICCLANYIDDLSMTGDQLGGLMSIKIQAKPIIIE